MRLSTLVSFLLVWLFLSSTLYSQPMPKPAKFNDYRADWDLVAKKTREGLPKSALELVEKIYSRAKSKAMFHSKSKLSCTLFNTSEHLKKMAFSNLSCDLKRRRSVPLFQFHLCSTHCLLIYIGNTINATVTVSWSHQHHSSS
jgi:hypothetical protein